MTEQTDTTPSWIDRLGLWLLAAALVIVPSATSNLTGIGIGHFPLTYDTIALPRLCAAMMLVSAGLAAWLLVAARNGWRVRIAWALPALLALAGWSVVSMVASPHAALALWGQSERREGVMTFVGYAAVFGLASQVVRARRDAMALCVAAAIGATIPALYGVSQFLGFDPTNYAVENYGFDPQAAFATLGNPNFLAGLLVLALPICVALALGKSALPVRLAWGAAALVSALAIYASVTRGAWIAVVAEAVVFALMWWRARLTLSKTATWIAVGVTVLAFVIGAASLASTGESRSVADRSTLMRESIAAIARHPVTGIGPDAFIAAYREVRSNASANTYGSSFTLNNAHSWPLQIAATLGVPGAIIFLVALACALWGAGHGVMLEGEGADPVLLGAFVGCAGFVVHMLTSVAVLAATIPFFALLGILCATGARRIELPVSLLRTAGIVATVVSVGLLALGAVKLSADHDFLQSRLELHGMQSGSAIASAEDAARLQSGSIKYERGVAEIQVMSVRAAITNGASHEQLSAAYASALAALDRALAVDRDDYPSLAWKAALQADVAHAAGDSALAAQAIQTAKAAAALDRQHSEVAALVGGDTSAGAISAAYGVPPLP